MILADPSSADFFEAKYRSDSDPWDFAGSEYEQRRYDAIVGALDNRRYRRAFEPGCSVGVLTSRLAALCERVEAIDFSPSAVLASQLRCAHLANVEIYCGSLGTYAPLKEFDLLILSEIGYYFTPEDWQNASAGLIASLRPSGTLLAAHWLGVSDDHCMEGDQVHNILGNSPRLRLESSERYEGFRLERWLRI